MTKPYAPAVIDDIRAVHSKDGTMKLLLRMLFVRVPESRQILASRLLGNKRAWRDSNPRPAR